MYHTAVFTVVMVMTRKAGNCDALQLEATGGRDSRFGLYAGHNAPAHKVNVLQHLRTDNAPYNVIYHKNNYNSN